MTSPSNPLSKLPGQIQRNLLGVVAGAYLLLFSAVWIWIGYRLLSFNATADHPKVEFATLRHHGRRIYGHKRVGPSPPGCWG